MIHKSNTWTGIQQRLLRVPSIVDYLQIFLQVPLVSRLVLQKLMVPDLDVTAEK
jgi:hypothetical protein